MKSATLTLAALLISAGAVPFASANVLIKVDQSTQRMTVDVDGRPVYHWRVSTGRPGFETPNGTFRPNRMDADHHSEEYDNAAMPHAVFFDLHGHAIHGSYDPIGRPAASHGCVRLAPADAAKLFDLVSKEGMGNTKVEIGGDVRVALGGTGGGRKVREARRLASARVAARAAAPVVIYGDDMTPPPAPVYRQDVYGSPYSMAPTWGW